MDSDWLKLLFVLWGILIVCFIIWWVRFKEPSVVKRARGDIFVFVKGYKKKCTGMNRFVVTVETLQNSFREYETSVISMIWLELVKEHIIEQDPLDGEWVVK